MTHSLHRRGTRENLKDDFVVLITPAVGINHNDSKDKLIKILNKILELGPNNIGSYETGTVYSGATIQQIKEQLSETPRVRCCFDNPDKVEELVAFIKESGCGLSVTVSGLIDDVKAIAAKTDISPHSINLSLGTFGKTEELPEYVVLEFVTMCGHGMISSKLVEKLIDDVVKGRMSFEKAAMLMAQPCVCGIFNAKRAEELLDKYVR
ncbi:MAG: hypothetical protein VR72_06135 [Clostridiaceae bacterium BRH_c20a]|nr:MAG: hypothetical protein VR72_06135 [Clostridiaceae bacterium BRH_c20a]